MKLPVSDSSIQSLSLSPLFTDGFCFLFPSPLGFPNTLSLIAFPLLPLYRFRFVYLMHRLLYAPFAFCIHFDLVYPKHVKLGSSLVSTASFCQNRTFSSEQFYFFGFHTEPSKARVSYWKLFCWFLFHTVFHAQNILSRWFTIFSTSMSKIRASRDLQVWTCVLGKLTSYKNRLFVT